MKIITYVSALALTSALASQGAYADPKKEDIKGAASFSAGAIIGALAGGPAGMFVGALGGALWSEQNKKHVETKTQLQETEQEMMTMAVQLDEKQAKIINLEERVVSKLEFKVLFPTGDDQLNFQDAQRIRSLAKYLNKNPELRVRLDGHADPRGTDEYNNVLSSERAKAVADALIEKGVAENRIDIHYHGASLAVDLGDRDQYALERRVNIEVYAKETDNVAAN